MTTTIEPKTLNHPSTHSEPSIEPNLAPPGAGIGLFPSLVLRYFVKPMVASRATREESKSRFHKINQKILKEIDGLNELQLTTKVLVPPQRGLEDSSRYWSIRMVLEHLCIVSSQMFQVIEHLSNGQIPNRKADTAAVKPTNRIATGDVVFDFKKIIQEDFEKMDQNFSNFDANLKFKHPWFGPMRASAWYWLLGIHHSLHLKQIREIKKGLPLL